MPLARWLSDSRQSIPDDRVWAADEPVWQGGDSHDDCSAARFAEAEERARTEGRNEAEARLGRALEEQQSAALVREAERDAMWAARCLAVSETVLSALKADLQKGLEEALEDVLRPFLADTIRARAQSELSDLIARELEMNGDALLEFRAPASMHDDIRSLLDRSGLKVMLIDSQKIEILSRTGSRQFESLAAAWIAHIRSGES